MLSDAEGEEGLSAVCVAWEGFAARVETGAGAVEKGFAGRADGVVEDEAKGLLGLLADDVVGLLPKSDAPMFVFCAGGGDVAVSGGAEAVSGFAVFVFGFAGFATRTPRIVRILPGFLRQAGRLQAKMYRRRSWPGKRSGSSPFNCRRRAMWLLQDWHLASEAEGG